MKEGRGALMKITFKPGVREYLNNKNTKNIYIEMDNKGGCCSGPVYVPEVRMGIPKYLSMYDSFTEDEIVVYIPKKVLGEDAKDITIKVRNILGQKSLIVNGILAYKDKVYGNKKI